MKKDLGKSYDNSTVATNAPEKYYPSTTLESDNGLDIPENMMNTDIEVNMTVRIVRKSTNVDKKGKKQSLDLEFRKIDFGGKIKDQDIQDDITDAIEGLQESQTNEDSED